MRTPATRLALVAALVLAAPTAARAAEKPQEAKLLATLQDPDAELKDKSDACRLLARVGTKDAVPVLAGLLGEEKLSHMARYALEPIPDPAVDEALRAALGKLEGRHLIGVIASVGVREDAKAVPALAKYLSASEAGVAEAAARALGSIGTEAAADALEAALPRAPADSRVAFCEGLFRCAEALRADAQTERARALYDRLRQTRDAPHQVRAGALRGAVLVRGEEGLPLLLEALRGDDWTQVAAAARTAMEMPQEEVTEALADELGKLPADKQILVVQTLGTRGEAGAVPALLALAKKGDKAARVAAIRALPMIGHPTAVPVLVELFEDPDDEVAKAARDALAALEGEAVDAALADMLDADDATTRRLAVTMLAQRRADEAPAALMKAAKQDQDESVRVASIRALGELDLRLEQFPALVDLLVAAKSADEIRVLESTLAGLCKRLARPAAGKITIHKAVYGDLPDGKQEDVTRKVAQMVEKGAIAVEATNDNFGDPVHGTRKKLRVDYTVAGTRTTKTVDENETLTLTAGVAPKACLDALCEALPRAPAEPKIALLRVLRSAGGSQALEALRAATEDDEAEVRAAAVATLCGWPTVEALPHVLELARSAESPRTRILALRGAIRLIPMQAVPARQKVASMKDALGLARRDEEKKLALAALGDIPAPEALDLTMAHLGDAGLKEEACLAAVAVAEKILGDQPAQVAQAMGKVIKATANQRLAKQARQLLARARKAAGGK
ncbi:MAG: HEAT repeat domain-containing protein [Candidatus Brocadiia bacterium]